MNVLLRGIVGSTVYGLSHKDSDVDKLGIYAASTLDLCTLYPPGEKEYTVVQNDPDIVLHEAGKFCRLALKGNPSITELLYLEKYDQFSPLGLRLVAMRSSFLSASSVENAYLGYAIAQFKRLNREGYFQAKYRKRTEKHARHILRLMDQGYELFTTGSLTLKVSDPDKYFDFGKKTAKDKSVADLVIEEYKEKFSITKSVLPELPDVAAVKNWLDEVRRANFEVRIAGNATTLRDSDFNHPKRFGMGITS